MQQALGLTGTCFWALLTHEQSTFPIQDLTYCSLCHVQRTTCYVTAR